MARILLVEDNLLTARGLEYLLEREKYDIHLAISVTAARAELEREKFDLVLLDVSLPDGTGFGLARELSDQSLPAERKPAIIFLTAKDDEADVVRGLELGAEDYITKPFHNRELLLRVKKALRKTPENITRILTTKHITLNLDTGETLVDGQKIELTALEIKILACLLEANGAIVTRERLMDEIWTASGSVVNDNTVSVYIKRLRQKLGDVSLIETVKNMGYKLTNA